LRKALLLLAFALGACATAVRAPLVEGEDYSFPTPLPGELRPGEGGLVEEAWREVLLGRTEEAETRLRQILLRHPGSVSAQTGLAYAALRAGRLADARRGFENVLGEHPDYLPALLGAGSVAVRTGDPESALSLYRRAQAMDPQNPTARRRLAEVKLQVTERRVASARSALASGDLDAAIDAYRAALEAAPEVGGLRVELADLLASRGDSAGAAQVLREDLSQDHQVEVRLAALLMDMKDYAGALDVFRRILARDPRDLDAQKGSVDARSALELQGMPEEYRRIYTLPQITRADLAALVAVKVTALSRASPKEPQVAVDISGSWAREHIIRILSFDILDVYSNHTFQPGAIVRRGDLARAVGRILDVLRSPGGPPPSVTDMSPNNILFDSVQRTVGAGLMELTPSGAFEAWRPVSGPEAVEVLEGLIRVVGP
jgi:tetratricopeptide (TPR) repeat protein